jgi:hypothetical protein
MEVGRSFTSTPFGRDHVDEAFGPTNMSVTALDLRREEGVWKIENSCSQHKRKRPNVEDNRARATALIVSDQLGCARSG